MSTIIRASESIARGELSRSSLRSHYKRLYPDVYTPRVAEPSLYANTVGAWLWSKQRGVVSGRAAAALHGAKWVDPDCAIELILDNHRPPRGIITRNDPFDCDDVVEINGMAVAAIQRTALDLGRFLHRNKAVAHLDALAAATGLQTEHVSTLVDRFKGYRGIRRCRVALDLMDGGAQSPKESWLRLLLNDAGYPRPTTQIPLFDGHTEPFAFLDMGWEDLRIAVEYDGEHHQTHRRHYVWDMERQERIRRLGWHHVRVIKEDRTPDILRRVAAAWALRETEGRVVKRPA
ncbi:hypothetical protein O6P37_08065 [Mycobacterium sp. CPCC 205372]|uniref:Cullin, a subunit of E3 ubiquitin ligase n=1 Tax=Mycobacterium hippophais TaxID=3016340 RepID=A0ABT4PQG3_9MYCO|nr:hypothetical protein [Mycobacterium hippophais]MCZ8378810.1 hypothetical protein [Mycobacterium hippophais]